MSDAPVAPVPAAPPTDGPSRLQRLEAKRDSEIEAHNELHRQIEDGEKQLTQARNRLFQIQGRIELLNEEIQDEQPPSSGPAPLESPNGSDPVDVPDPEDN